MYLKKQWANQTFVILPSDNHTRINTLVKKLISQNIEIYTNTKPLKYQMF